MKQRFFAMLMTILWLELGFGQSAFAQALVVSGFQTEFSLDGATWSSAVATWVHPSWPKIDGATWIWRTATVAKDEAVQGSPVVTFRHKFTAPSGAPRQATLQITADNAYQASLNGRLIGSNGVLDAASNADQQWRGIDSYKVTLRPGSNELIVRAINYHSPLGASADGQSNPAGVIFALKPDRASLPLQRGGGGGMPR